MKKIYVHIELARVGHYQSILEEHQIPSTIKNEHSAIGVGEIPFIEVWPELWVINDEDFEKATQVLKEYHDNREALVEPWICAHCNTNIEYGFEECWSCGKMKDEKAV